MNPALKNLLDRALARSPAQGLMRHRGRRRLAVLAYHGVDDRRLFGRHLDWLAREMTPVSIDDVADASAGRRELPDRAVLVTFDDGHRTVLEAGAPLLQERGIPAVAFVVAGLLDTEEPFWWDEVEQLSLAGGRVSWWTGPPGRALVLALKRVPDQRRLDAIAELRRTSPARPAPAAHLRRDELVALESAGVAVGNHSLSHACLSRCDDDKIGREVRASHAILTDALGRPPRSFAYPDGQHDGRVAATLREVGYDVAFLFDHRPAVVPSGDPLATSRLRMNSDNSMARFEIIVSGVHSAIHHAVGRR